MKKLEKIAYSPAEVETSFSIPVGTQANLRLRGEGPRFFRLGRKILYLREDVEAWIKREPVETKDSIELTR